MSEPLPPPVIRKTSHGIIVDCDKDAKQRRLLVPHLLGEPAFATLMRARVLAKEIGADPDHAERAVMRRLVKSKPNTTDWLDHLFSEFVVKAIPDVDAGCAAVR